MQNFQLPVKYLFGDSLTDVVIGMLIVICHLKIHIQQLAWAIFTVICTESYRNIANEDIELINCAACKL